MARTAETLSYVGFLVANPTPMSRTQKIVLVSAAGFVQLFSILHFDGPSRGYWDTYISVPAMFMTNQPVNLVRTDGVARYHYTLKGRIPDNTYDPSPGSFGIASEDQRIGSAILFGAPFAIFNLAAFRWGYATSWTFLFLFSFLVLRRLLTTGGNDANEMARFHVPLFASLFLIFNPFSLYLDRLNGNLFGLSIQVFLFFLLIELHPTWWLIGLVYGLLGGIRNEAIVLAPMVLAFLIRDGRTPRRFAYRLMTFTGAAFIAILPVLMWNRYAYGQMLIHPSQVARLEGFRPTFPHQFFGATFQFNGLLNWPFHDHLVRTPHFALPTFLLWPLVTIKSLGVALSGTALIGVAVLYRRRRFEALMLLFWYLAYYALFFPQENWEELKQTFLALHLFPVLAFVAAGLVWIAAGWRSWQRWAAIAGLSAAIACFTMACRLIDVPADERWYVRFPHAKANDSGLAELPEGRRKDWYFFYTRETAGEIDREKRLMTTPHLFPSRYRPWHFAAADDLGAIVTEPRRRDLTTLAIWSYIYE